MCVLYASLWAGWGSTYSGVTKDKKDAFVNDAPWFGLLEGEPPCPWAFAQAVHAMHPGLRCLWLSLASSCSPSRMFHTSC